MSVHTLSHSLFDTHTRPSPHYAAPEVIMAKESGTGYRFECDMWAVGVICYTLLCCQYPFDGDSDLEVIKKVQKGTFDFPDHVKVTFVAIVTEVSQLVPSLP